MDNKTHPVGEVVQLTMDKLREMGNEEGTIDVSDDPVHPTYMP